MKQNQNEEGGVRTGTHVDCKVYKINDIDNKEQIFRSLYTQIKKRIKFSTRINKYLQFSRTNVKFGRM